MSSAPKITDLPDVGSTLESLARFCQAVREVMQTREGRRGNALEEGVTFRDMVEAGLVTRAPGGGWVGGAGSGIPGPAGPVGPPGPPGVYVPDLTPPPTPDNLRAVSLFKGVLIEWDAPAYTQGHGNAYTAIYVAQYASGPLPVFTDAVKAGQAGGASTLYHHEAAMGTQLHIWATFVTQDGVESPVPAGGINGFQITVGHVGHSDLGQQIIQADNIASGAITPATFQSGTAPVFFGAALPALPHATFPAGTLFIRTSDYKVHRSTGIAWTAAADGADIVANTIVAGQVGVGGLQAGTITAGSAAIADGAIRNALIENLAVTNAKIADVSAFKLTAGSIGVGEYIESTGFVAGSTGWRILGNGQAEFASASIRGTLTAAQIGANTIGAGHIQANSITAGNIQAGTFSGDNVHTRGLTIRDASGNIILGAGSGLPLGYVPAGALNSNVTLGSLGYTGALNATNGATFGVNISGQITSGNASTYIASAAIGASLIGSVALVGTSNFSVMTAASGARMDMDSRRIKVFDASGTLRVQLGDLTV